MGLRIALIILLIASPLWAVTKTKTVKEVAGDYTTLEACLNANESNLTAGVGTLFVASIEGDWTQGDSTTVLIDGWTTNSSYFITAITDSDARHPGYRSTSDYILAPTATRGIACKEAYTVIDGLQIDATTSSGVGIWFLDDPNFARVSNCIITGDGGDRGIQISGLAGSSITTIYINNDIIHDVGNRGIDIDHDSAEVYVSNVTIHTTSSVGIYAQAGSTIAKNNLVENPSNGYLGTFHSSSDYNTSGDGTSTGGGNDRINQTFTFINEGANDFRLTSGDAGAREHGTDLSGDGNLPFNDDIVGRTRPISTNWDMGAYEADAPGAPAASPRRRNLSTEVCK